jgi:Leucine-rich repeat (LRR) protein
MSFVELFYNLKELDLTGNNITYIEGLQELKRI